LANDHLREANREAESYGQSIWSSYPHLDISQRRELVETFLEVMGWRYRISEFIPEADKQTSRGSSPVTSGVSSSLQENKDVGGIDFRVIPMYYPANGKSFGIEF